MIGEYARAYAPDYDRVRNPGAFTGAFTPDFTGGYDAGTASLTDMPWTLTVGGVDVSTRTAWDFTVTTGRRDADSQPDAGDATFTVVPQAGDDGAAWARPGEPVRLTVTVLGDVIEVASMVVARVTRTFLPSEGAWRIQLSCVGVLAGVARSSAGGLGLYPQEGDVTRVVRYLSEAGQPLDYRQTDGNRILDDATGQLWVRSGTVPVSLTRTVARAYRVVDMRVTVTVDAAARIVLWAFGRTVTALNVYYPGTYELRGMALVDPLAPSVAAVIAGGLLDPNTAGAAWMDEDATVTWAGGEQTATWDAAKQSINVAVVSARMWNADLPQDSVVVTAREPKEAEALGLVTEVATAARGVLWETSGGTLRYESATDRGPHRFPAVTLPADLIVGQSSTESDTGDLVNYAVVSYGDQDPVTGKRAQMIRGNTSSLARYGRYEVTIDGPLARRTDARVVADRLVLGRAYPADRMAGLTTLDSGRLPLVMARRLLRLPLGALVAVTGAAPGWSEDGSWEGYLEGWTVTGRAGRLITWEVTLTPRRDFEALIDETEPGIQGRAARAFDPVAIFDAAIPGYVTPPNPAAQFGAGPADGGTWWEPTRQELSAWNGSRWIPVGGAPVVTAAAFPPSDPKPGDVWVQP